MCSVVFAFKSVVLLGFNCAAEDSCMLLSLNKMLFILEYNTCPFYFKLISIIYVSQISFQWYFSVGFMWDREPEKHIPVAVLIHNLISVCCSIARLLRSSVVECAGIRLYWLKFHRHQIWLGTESPDQAGLQSCDPCPAGLLLGAETR